MDPVELRRLWLSRGIAKRDYILEMGAIHETLAAYAELLTDSVVSRLEIAPGEVVATAGTPPVRIAFDPRERRVAPVEMLNFGEYEGAFWRALRGAVADGDVVFDIGANVGWVGLSVAAAFPRCRVYAFEPIPETYDYLERNIALNGLANIVPGRVALGAEEGDAVFYRVAREGTAASARNITGDAGAERVSVPVRRLDDVAEEHGVQPAVLKCDVEGGELLVFQGAERTLERARPLIFTELLRKWAGRFSYHPNDVLTFLGRHGYACFAVDGSGARRVESVTDETVETNFLFADPERHGDRLSL